MNSPSASNSSFESRKKMYESLFRAYDIRGIYGSEIDPDMCFFIGVAACRVVLKDLKPVNRKLRVFIGFDIRQTSQTLVYSLVSGVLSTGSEVIFSGSPYPFGVVMFSGLQEKADFTIFITASHLPADWNGVKFYYGDGVGFAEEKIMAIRDEFLHLKENNQFTTASWNTLVPLTVKSYFQEYISFMKKNFSLSSPLKVIIDGGNGSASLSAPAVFSACNYATTLQWCTVDPSFPNRPSEPNEETLKVLSKAVLSQKVDFGVGFDGDGDRAVIVDDLGRVIPADEIAILIARYLKKSFSNKNKPPLLLANIECSSAFEKNLKNDFTIKRIKVGHTFLTLEARINRDMCLLGVESSGHFVFPQFFLFDDAMLLPLILGKVLLSEKKKLSDLLQTIPKMFTVRKVFKCSDDTKFGVIDKLTAELRKAYPNINDIDGVAITLEDGYVLIRASNTGPKIRLFVESSIQSRANSLVDTFSPLLEKYIGH